MQSGDPTAMLMLVDDYLKEKGALFSDTDVRHGRFKQAVLKKK